MGKKNDYSKIIKTAKELIAKFGTTATVLLENDTVDDDYAWKHDESKVVSYEVNAVFIPPVNGIYFQGTRFGEHTLQENDLSSTKEACLIAPIYDSNGNNISLTNVTAIVRNGIKYRVTFCDTLCPANDVAFYAYGIGR